RGGEGIRTGARHKISGPEQSAGAAHMVSAERTAGAIASRQRTLVVDHSDLYGPGDETARGASVRFTPTFSGRRPSPRYGADGDLPVEQPANQHTARSHAGHGLTRISGNLQENAQLWTECDERVLLAQDMIDAMKRTV